MLALFGEEHFKKPRFKTKKDISLLRFLIAPAGETSDKKEHCFFFFRVAPAGATLEKALFGLFLPEVPSWLCDLDFRERA